MRIEGGLSFTFFYIFAVQSTRAMTRTEEKLLLQALGNSDKRAFAVLYNMYAGKCLGFVQSIIKDSDAAKDITHDIFVKVWLKREVISRVDNFSSYLFRMVKNATMDKLESEVIRRKFVTEQLISSENFRSYVDERISVDELQMLIFKAVSNMPEQRRRIFTLSRYKGVSNTEIARIFDINVRTVENHLTNALADIRLMLAEVSYKG